jgi:hypothetical protein
MRSSAVIFDLGGVVLSWDPRGAYERVLPAGQIATFLERVDFAGWNRLNDGGRPACPRSARPVRRLDGLRGRHPSQCGRRRETRHGCAELHRRRAITR